MSLDFTLETSYNYTYYTVAARKCCSINRVLYIYVFIAMLLKMEQNNRSSVKEQKSTSNFSNISNLYCHIPFNVAQL